MTGVAAIVVAAGEGRRFGSPKQFALLAGRSVLEWSLAAFEAHPRVGEIVLVLPDEALGPRFAAAFAKVRAVVRGGVRRQDSVLAGFSRLDRHRTDIVLIHDGARPLVGDALIRRIIREAAVHGAALPALPVEDTVKEGADNRVVRTVDRSRLYRVQTPQGFTYEILEEAFRRAAEDGFTGTDDASLVERLGKPVALVEGDPQNIKITTLLDLKWAEEILHDANRARV
jgi:2-C-methyl-D-erythritol 4-phosphate cytidylyltransferase